MKTTADKKRCLQESSPFETVINGSAVMRIDCRYVESDICDVMSPKMVELSLSQQIRPVNERTHNSADSVRELRQLKNRSRILLPHLNEPNIVSTIPSAGAQSDQNKIEVELPQTLRIWYENHCQSHYDE